MKQLKQFEVNVMDLDNSQACETFDIMAHSRREAKEIAARRYLEMHHELHFCLWYHIEET